MKIDQILVFMLMLVLITNCAQDNQTLGNHVYDDVKVVSAMKNVMWKGELGAAINLDTISNKKGLYGIGPETYLTGELLINDGKSYVSKVLSDSTMIVQKTFDTAAPFFVYANVNDWEIIDLPKEIKNIKDVELLIDQKTKDRKRPFAFKLIGKVESAIIHIQNLPPGTAVSSPAEAHQGQVNYSLGSEEVEIIGFFSTEHQAVFTHHDTYVHLHLMTKDESKMGHLDKVVFDKMKLYLPKGG
jgi:acetolactate decarboxylase